MRPGRKAFHEWKYKLQIMKNRSGIKKNILSIMVRNKAKKPYIKRMGQEYKKEAMNEENVLQMRKHATNLENRSWMKQTDHECKKHVAYEENW